MQEIPIFIVHNTHFYSTAALNLKVSGGIYHDWKNKTEFLSFHKRASKQKFGSRKSQNKI